MPPNSADLRHMETVAAGGAADMVSISLLVTGEVGVICVCTGGTGGTTEALESGCGVGVGRSTKVCCSARPMSDGAAGARYSAETEFATVEAGVPESLSA